MADTTDAPPQEEAAAATTTDAPPREEQPVVAMMQGGSGDGYCQRQVGLLGILLILSGLGQIGQIVQGNYGAAGNLVVWILMGLGFLWIQVEDKGDYLLVVSGPCRWTWCGWGKEKVKYDEIRDYEVRLMNNCSCCQCSFCGPTGTLQGGCCSQTTVRLTINERNFGLDARDDGDCCLESCCLNNCFGAACNEPCGCCGPRGEGCWFSMCNPCRAHCCAMNTMFLSTNDPEGLIKLLNKKTGKNVETQSATI